MTSHKKLDKALEIMYKEYENGNSLFLHSKSVCEKAKLKVKPQEAHLILRKLNYDEYLDVDISNEWIFRINCNGVLFYLNGGYAVCNKHKRLKKFKKDFSFYLNVFFLMVTIVLSLLNFDLSGKNKELTEKHLKLEGELIRLDTQIDCLLNYQNETTPLDTIKKN